MTDNSSSPPNSNKKSTLKKGIDENVSRKLREDRSVQIRKDKRLDRTNLQRRRFQEDDEDEETKKKNKFKGIRRNLDALPEKARQLHGEDMEELLDSVMYFRKVLAIGTVLCLDFPIDNFNLLHWLLSIHVVVLLMGHMKCRIYIHYILFSLRLLVSLFPSPIMHSSCRQMSPSRRCC